MWVGLSRDRVLPFFALVMNGMTGELRQKAPWTILFADDIVICSESKGHAQEKLDSWRYAFG